MPTAPTSSLRTGPAAVLRDYPAAALEVAPDGVITDSNGGLEREGCASVVGRVLSELLEPGSRDDWRRLLESGAPDASIIALAFRRSNGGRSRTFLVARGPGAQDGLRLFEQRCRSGEAERLARTQGEAAVRQHDEVLAIVAHDLRNPLNQISLSASVLRECLGAAADPRPWELMQRGVKDMDRLIQDLLDVSRMEAGASGRPAGIADCSPGDRAPRPVRGVGALQRRGARLPHGPRDSARPIRIDAAAMSGREALPGPPAP